MMSQARSTDLTALDLSWLQDGGPFPEEVVLHKTGGTTSKYTLEDRTADGRIFGAISRHGKKGFVLFGTSHDTGESVALKFCVETDYQTTSRTPQDEAKLAIQLKGLSTNFAIPRETGSVQAFDSQPDKSTNWVCFVSERIYGDTVKSWARKYPERVTPNLVCEIAEALIKVVLYLEAKKLKHDDLHWGNLMLREIDPAARLGRPETPEYELCVIDTGSLKPLEQPTNKPHDDWSQVSGVLAELHNVIHRNRETAARNAGMLRRLEMLCSALLETDKSLPFPTQSAYFEAVDQMRREIRGGDRELTIHFDPFGVISAEHLADDSLLLDLFVKALPWMTDVARPTPMVVMGPRGCGKSMLFRFLSARTHIGAKDDVANQLGKLPFFGVYLSCSSDLQSELHWLARRPDLVRERRESIISLFGLLLSREFFKAVDKLLYRPEVANQVGISEADVAVLIDYCRQLMGFESTMPRLRVSSIAGNFADEIDLLRRDTSLAIARGDTPKHVLPEYFLRDFAELASKQLIFLRSQPLVFLLDDYTSHRIPHEVQALLNPIVFSRQSAYVFKVSCEYFGLSIETSSDLRIDPNREFESVDTGQWVVERLSTNDRREFLESLIDQRLVRAGYAAKAKDLIGASEHKKDSELARTIKASGVGKQTFYSGLEVLGNLWSGDIATMLHFVRTMFQKGKVKRDSTQRIEGSTQSEAIREVSRGLFVNIRGYQPFGEQMHSIIENFGGMASDLLRYGREDAPRKKASPGGKSPPSTPQRKYRVEMTKDGPYDIFRELTQRSSGELDLGTLARELIRRSVLIQIRPSTGKEGRDTETIRWQMRSALLPAFGVSLVHQSYIDVKTFGDLTTFLSEPKRFRDDYTSRYGRAPDLFDRENEH